jgi:hypothetical protein
VNSTRGTLSFLPYGFPTSQRQTCGGRLTIVIRQDGRRIGELAKQVGVCSSNREANQVSLEKEGQPSLLRADRFFGYRVSSTKTLQFLLGRNTYHRHRLRGATQQVIFLNFEYATAQGVEDRVWDVTIQIKNRYKRLLDRVPEQARVERRKLEKRYVDFLKTTQFFYKGYIQRLASSFGGLKDLRRIAHRLTLETLSVDAAAVATPALELLIEASCHITLLHLGDLSRYRNELRMKKPTSNWESALAYYGLARDMCPDSGSSHNQMAVIALADQNHLDALYHLHRAIAVKQPHSLARGNLEIEFKKITSMWDKKEKQTIPHAKSKTEEALILWFVLLHAKLYKGVDFSEHDEMESTVLTNLALLLKEQSFEITLERIVVINISAGYLAGERIQGECGLPLFYVTSRKSAYG